MGPFLSLWERWLCGYLMTPLPAGEVERDEVATG
jgi:hypothetical protein